MRTSVITRLLGAVLLVVTLSGSALAQEVVLKYSSWLPPSHAANEVFSEWIADIERVTDGRVTIEYLPATVRSAREQFDVVTEGLADVVIVVPGFTPGRFPTLEAGEFPLLVPTNIGTLGPAFNQFYTDELAASDPFKGAHVLGIMTGLPFHIATRTGPIDTIDKFAGLKLRAPSATGGDIITAMGGVSVVAPGNEVYERASTGIIDGTFYYFGAMVDWKVGDILPHVAVVPGGMGQSVTAILVNQSKWDSLSEADRNAIMTVSGEALVKKLSDKYQADEDEALETLQKSPSFKVTNVSDAFFEELKVRLAPLEAAWAARAKAAGLKDPEGSLARLRESLRAAAN